MYTFILGIVATLIGGLLVALFTPLFDQINIIKRYLEVKKWRKEKMRKLRLSSDSKEKVNVLKLIESKCFIPTKVQTESPNDKDHIICSKDRFDLIDKLLGDFFSKQKYPEPQRYAILGGSGMGKTTFAVYLFLRYINKPRFRLPQRDIHFINLSEDGALNEIRELKEKKLTDDILLLEALDENYDAVNDCLGYLKRLEVEIYSFTYVIVISRTQLFPKERNVFVDVVTPDAVTRLRYQKYYISPFSQDEIDKYIDTKYFNDEGKKQEAKRIVKDSFDLMCRPMILSNIDKLLNIKEAGTLSSAVIYHTIIDKWLQRELEHDYFRIIQANKLELFTFSKLLALYIYNNWKTGSQTGIRISKSDYMSFLINNSSIIFGEERSKILLDKKNEEDMFFESRSLINKDLDGNIKFSHKSFFEFFLAVISMEQPWQSFNPDGLDTAVQFAKDMQKAYLSQKIENMSLVSFYGPHFYSTESSDSIYDGLFSEVDTMSKDVSLINNHNSDLYYKLYLLWEVILKGLPETYEILLRRKNSSQNMDLINSLLSGFPGFFSKENTDMSFVFLKLSLATFRKELSTNKLLDLAKGKGVSELFCFKETVMFPNIDANEFLVERYLNNTIFMGHGIASDEEVFEYLCTIAHKKETINSIVIFVAEDTKEQQASYIKKCVESVRAELSLLIFFIPLNGIIIYYTADKNTVVSEKQILDYFEGISAIIPKLQDERE